MSPLTSEARCGPSRGNVLRTALLAVSAFAWLAAAASAAAGDRPQLFNSRETRSEGLKPFPKWRGVLQRHLDKPGQLNAFLTGLNGRDLMSQVEAVNREMNRRAYIVDPRNWGVPDYWASPLEFLRKQGDCEDYAIAKFLSLRALGVPNDRLRIVVLKDLNLRLGHAVLVVYMDDKAYVLDNQISHVIAAERIRHYKPIFSLNEEAWWLHRTRS